MPPGTAVAVLVLFGAVIAGLAAGVFSFSLGSFLIWGFIIGVALAVLARWFFDAAILGQLWALGYTVVLIIFLIRLIF